MKIRNRFAALITAAGLAVGAAASASATEIVAPDQISINAAGLGGSSFETNGGAGTVNDDLVFNSSTGSANYSGSIYIDIGSFEEEKVNTKTGKTREAKVTDAGVGSTWQLYAVITVAGSGVWSSGTFDGLTTPDMSGSISIYAVSGTPCSFANSGVSCGESAPVLLANGPLLGSSFLEITGANNSNPNDGEIFNILTDLTSDSSDLMPSGDLAISLTVNSGESSGVTKIDAYDPSLSSFQTGSCSEEDKAWTCDASSDDVSWKAGDPVPEPGSLALLGSGLVGLGAFRRRIRKAD